LGQLCLGLFLVDGFGLEGIELLEGQFRDVYDPNIPVLFHFVIVLVEWIFHRDY
jgi:hypothetical protein